MDRESRPFQPSSRRVKVAHVATASMGLRYLLLNQCLFLQQRGYEVTGVSAPGPYVRAVEEAGIRHLAVPMKRSVAPLADLLALYRLFRVMRRERFTIVHTHNPKPGLLGQLAARMAGVPIVVNTVHGFYFHEGMAGWLRRFYVLVEKVAARRSSLILSQSAEDVRTALEEGICPPGKIRYLGNGIDVRRFSRSALSAESAARVRDELGLRGTEQVVGFVGRLVAEKGIFELLEAARRVAAARPGVRFLFVGPVDHAKRDAVTPAVARDYGLEDVCVFAGERQDMPVLYALMDVFVLPSHREGFPRAPMEASAMEVPCVVTDVRGCREVVEPDRNGVLVPPGDAAALGAAILAILSDAERAGRMGREGRRMAEARFDERRVFETVAAAYEDLLRASGRAVPRVAARPEPEALP